DAVAKRGFIADLEIAAGCAKHSNGEALDFIFAHRSEIRTLAKAENMFGVETRFGHGMFGSRLFSRRGGGEHRHPNKRKKGDGTDEETKATGIGAAPCGLDERDAHQKPRSGREPSLRAELGSSWRARGEKLCPPRFTPPGAFARDHG